MRARLPALVAVLVAAATPAVAIAEPMPVDSVTPTNGGVYLPTTTSVGFEIKSPVLNMTGMTVEITTQNIPGQDGTLADDFRVDWFYLFQSDAYPGTYRGGSNGGVGRWAATPGTYYWQATARCSWYATGRCTAANPPDPQYGISTDKKFDSPVFTITMRAAQPQPQPQQPTSTGSAREYPLSRATATRKVKARVSKQRRGRDIKAACSRIDVDQFSCRVRYRTRQNKLRRTEIVIWRSGRDKYEYL